MTANNGKDLVANLRLKAQESLYFTATGLLGYDKLTPHFHYEMCQIAQNAEKHKRVLCLVPRDHYKSTIFTISYPTWRAIRNPNETGLIVANTSTNAGHFLTKIRTNFERKALLRQLFPELRPELSGRWNKEEACLPRTIDHPEATWEAAGWDTKVTSRHYDYIVFDDLVDEETYDKPELMLKLIDRFEQRESLLRPPIHERTIIVVMNHWSIIDLACHILKKHSEYEIYYRAAIENGKPLFPEMYTMEWLLRKQGQDPYTFALQYMNNPVDRSISEMKPEDLHYYRKGDNAIILGREGEPDYEVIPLAALNIYTAVDLRHSLSTTKAQKLTSRNTVMTVGIDTQGRRFLLDEYAERSDPAALVKQILATYRKWHPIKTAIESFGYQKALQPLAAEIWKNEEDKPFLELLPHDTVTSKEARIRGGCQFFKEGIAYCHRSHYNFVEEFLGFPGGQTRDCLDGWAWAMQLANAPQSDHDFTESRMADRKYYDGLQGMARI
jgi:hypothetical protein